MSTTEPPSPPAEPGLPGEPGPTAEPGASAETGQTAEPGHPLAPIRREGYFGGGRLLAADLRVVSLFADEARRSALQRLLGIPKADPSALVTLIALATAAEAIRRGMEGVSSPSRPSPIGLMTGVGVAKEVAYGIAGPAARETPYFGTLLVWAIIGTSTRFVVKKSLRGVRSVSHEARREFDHRYGHLIRPNRRRRRVVT
jgi:hypothetical protein